VLGGAQKMKRTIKRFDDDAAKPLKRVNQAAHRRALD